MPDASKEVAELDQWLAERNLTGLWNGNGTRRWEQSQAYLWKWADVNECVQAMADLIPKEMVSRRILALMNPNLDDGTISTIGVYIQCLKPGEVAESHRHSAGAIRFILQGAEEAYCVVQGERIAIGTGDLLTTPSMTWHGHYSDSSKPAIWVDALDNHLVGKLGIKQFGEPFPTSKQPLEHPDGFAARVFGSAKPPWLADELPNPPFRYPWEETFRSLQFFKESEIDPDPYDGIHLEYVHPRTGGPTLTTFSCAMQLLPARNKNATHRHNSATVYQVFRGQGTTLIGDQRFEWSQGDFFVIPPWVWHSHENVSTEDALLFSLSDHPAMAALGIYRKEVADR